jgi:tetratricopeptide (TPR) repeat protein
VLTRILKLFEQGIDLLKKVLKYQKNNIPLLTYFLENKAEVELTLGSYLSQILEPILGGQKIEQAYFQVGNFYYDSGWIEQANSMMNKVLQVNPSHRGAQELLQHCTANLPENLS